MLRELIAWVLNNYLGKYVGNLNTTQLTIALLSGEVELENLPLRKDALRNFGLPLEALSGSIGKVKLQVPVRQFRSAPWCILIENIHVVVGPINLNEWDSDVEEQTELEYKLSRLDEFEAKWRAQRDTNIESGYYASSYLGWMSYGTSLVTNIVENLQLKIKNVHIRYEDSITVPDHRFACGIKIESLSAQSCDTNWSPGFTSNWDQCSATFKLMELQNLSFYWDPLNNTETFGNLSPNELSAAMIKHEDLWKHYHIISPVSAQAKLKRDRSETPLRTRSRPRLTCELMLNEVSFSLIDWQYNQMVECMRGLNDIAKYRRFRLLRPRKKVKDNPKSWWIYAMKCNGFFIKDHEFDSIKAEEDKKYIFIYSKYLQNPNEVLPLEDKELKDKVEKDRNYDELLKLRETSYLSLPTVDPKSNANNQNRGMLNQWFPQWWYSVPKVEEETQESNITKTQKEEEKLLDQTIQDSTFEDEILNAFANENNVDTNSLLKRDSVFGKFDFILKKGILDICTESNVGGKTSMIQLLFDNLLLNVETRPRSGSHFVGLSLGSLLFKDQITQNTEFPDLIKPQFASEKLLRNARYSKVQKVTNAFVGEEEPLFILNYEKKPLSYNTDYRLFIKSQSVDIVYNTSAVQWLVEFFGKPHQLTVARRKIEAMKHRTKMELIKNWEHIVEGEQTERKTWTLEIDISAPQIIFVENVTDKNSCVVVFDFGRLQLTNGDLTGMKKKTTEENLDTSIKDSEEDESFVTPCSTPPGSPSFTDSPTLVTANSDLAENSNSIDKTINDNTLYDKIYDRYNIDLTDLQVVVCKGKDRLSYINLKGTSTLHVLDRFSISLQVERRVIHTNDPQFPSLTLFGTLPKLVAHVNEHKIAAVTHVLETISSDKYTSKSPTETASSINDEILQDTELNDTDLQKEGSKLMILQFAIDQMSLEIQSRGRSVAELQVTGVKAGYTKRPNEAHITLSVHGLLLVDAIQSFGPDFELLIASHRQIGIDSISGSLKQSEPCSPCSPGSPDPLQNPNRPTSPYTITRALNNLQRAVSPTWNASTSDLDALIIVEILLITEQNDEEIQIANIQFNNLDIIANQETIVELSSFINRVFPKKEIKHNLSMKNLNEEKPDFKFQPENNKMRTEITFDFHRLNVLVLRATMRESYVVGRKVGTFTMSEAKIHATLGAALKVEGSLGGLQILDLTPEGVNHQRILSVGKDPLTDPPNIEKKLLSSLTQEIYMLDKQKSEKALSFSISKNLKACVSIKIRMASVWYTHCARFIQELSCCASEFKHYIKTFARSIREKATDMALGLVQPHTQQTQNDLQNNRKSYSNKNYDDININFDIILDTPVLVLPRSSHSAQVLVAHLGKISINNKKISVDELNDEKTISNITLNEEIMETNENDMYSSYNNDGCDNMFDDLDIDSNSEYRNGIEEYVIDIRNMNLYSLDTSNRKGFRLSALPRAEEFYSCQEDAIAVVHDTAIRLEITSKTGNLFNVPGDIIETLMISGSVIRPLRLSLSRQQYEQLIDTIDNIFEAPTDIVKTTTETLNKHCDENLNTPQLENKLFLQNDFEIKQHPQRKPRKTKLETKVLFELPIFIIQLQNALNDPSIEISFRDFNINFDKNTNYETNVQISLRSILVEDLLCSTELKHRLMVTSSAPENLLRSSNAFSSNSCPNLVGLQLNKCEPSNSLPDNLETGFSIYLAQKNNSSIYPETPPPSPQVRALDNLVIYSSLIVDPESPDFFTKYHGLRQTSSIDFNCLNLMISVKSWLVILSFFGLLSEGDNKQSSSSKDANNKINEEETAEIVKKGNSELEISVRSLTLVLIRDECELAKANVSNAHFVVSTRHETKIIEGKLGSVSLYDLTKHGIIYREKFVTCGNEALNFIYKKYDPAHQNEIISPDANLKIRMSSVLFVYTKRFITEIQEFFHEFLQLQASVMKKIKPSEKQNDNKNPLKLEMDIKAESPIILLPMCSKSEQLIVANLGEFTLKNMFRLTDFIDQTNCIIDAMSVNLVNTDLFTAIRIEKKDNHVKVLDELLDMGGYILKQKGDSLLNTKCHLNLIIDRNLSNWETHVIPDISVQGVLSKLEAELTLYQYKLIRGFLSYNLGEQIDDVYIKQNFDMSSRLSLIETYEKPHENKIWTNLIINLDLQNVSVKLKFGEIDNDYLACINFIKSSLKIESFSDTSQDIDLVSQEILINDIRSDEKNNCFTKILQPIHLSSNQSTVQAEIHSRRRHEISKYVILLNNMRLMAILDWLENMQYFISQSEEIPKTFIAISKSNSIVDNQLNNIPNEYFELILNITDSELVFVEKPDQSDTNAVILKSTTIVSYRPNEIDKLISVNLNHLEVFSCIFGCEDDTALSIIDPVTINFDVKRDVLDIQLQKQLFIRLSYNDVKMFMRMLESIPKQTNTAKTHKKLCRASKYNQSSVNSLIALGFSSSDCIHALEMCEDQISEAAIWLTQHATPTCNKQSNDGLKINSIHLHGMCISICVIDDCKDADVPLLELSFSDLNLQQEIGDCGTRKGSLKGVFASDYYNRSLSGWEPLIESWKCDAEWTHSRANLNSRLKCINFKLSSDDLLKCNITTTIIDLFNLVKYNWTQDYYSSNEKTVSTEIRRRKQFIPFALKNETGLKLWFSTFMTLPGGSTKREILSHEDSKWISVEPGDTIPFKFGPPKKLRHHDSHILNLHQIGVRVEGWNEVGPISVDRVGIFFRHACHEKYNQMPLARIVFEVTLEGAAQKLITIRSALRLRNKLSHTILLKMEHLFGHLHFRHWPDALTTFVKPNETFNVPLSHVHAYLYFKPIITQPKQEISESNPVNMFIGVDYWKKDDSYNSSSSNNEFHFTDRSLHWKDILENTEVNRELRISHGNREKKYFILISLLKEGYPHRENVPGYSITLWPPLRIHNLLPCDLLYRTKLGQDRIASSETANINDIEIDENLLEISITLDNYPGSGKISVMTVYPGAFETDVRLYDSKSRLLNLKAIIQISKECGIQITIYAQYWFINKTGLPLVYRQEGASYDCSGQYSENEQARLISPFMFSFSDPDGSRSLVIRLGKRYGSNPPWCQPFNIQKNILHRQLLSSNTKETFTIGIDIHRGKGKYTRTNIITFSPRFQLYNRSNYRLQFAQKCHATTYNSSSKNSTVIEAVPGCHLPFHWPRIDQEQKLCVRLPDNPASLWSGSIQINEAENYYINIRDTQGQMYFLRLEVILQGATYFLIFGNAQVLPPPIRVDNFSEVPIKFFQPDPEQMVTNQSKITQVKPHSSVAYVLDEPNGPKVLKFEAPGNVVQTYALNELGQMLYNLTYENFIYIAFSGTFKAMSAEFSDYDVDSQQLVLGVRNDNRVVLVRKKNGDRSQLWRMNNEKNLEHEGSSPPLDQSKSNSSIMRYVLDLEKPPQPMQYINLIVRPANKQRRSTQKWRFTEEGRLMCEHSNMCVQASGGFFGMRPGSEAVLGMIVSDSHVITQSLVPIEQSIERQKLRPGSGVLSVSIIMDGPIKTIQIKDVKIPNPRLSADPNWQHASSIYDHGKKQNSSIQANENEGSEYNINIKLIKGLGISIISCRPYEELCFLTLENITSELFLTQNSRSLDLSIGDLQIDNQLFETACPIALFSIKNNDSPTRFRYPVININIKMLEGLNTNAIIFEHLIVSVRPVSIYLEERLMLRLAEFIGYGKKFNTNSLPNESDVELQNLATKLLPANVKRYYFSDFQISPIQIRLSVLTTSKLSPNLSDVKKNLGLTLIKFEDAVIDFKQFSYKHHFETMEVYLRAIKLKYMREIKWQAASILGSVDFLGNPLGFANDLSEGVSGLLFEGSVVSLVKNVTHGISNSTAKLTETLSDGLGRVVLDEQDTEARQKILEIPSGSNTTGEHLVAGFKGLGFGLLGGVTSIVKHTYVGAQSDGVYGFLSGLGKGIVGTVTKPVIGVLDLASETANAVREQSKSSNRRLPNRKRLPRCVTGAPGGLIPHYSNTHSKGQNHLFLINKRNFREFLMAYEPCLYQGDESRLRLLVSSENVYVFSRSEEVTTIIFSYNLSELLTCHAVSVVDNYKGGSSKKVQHYIELCLSVQSKNSGHGNIKRPRVRCQNSEMAEKASRHINYAKDVYDERNQSLTYIDGNGNIS